MVNESPDDATSHGADHTVIAPIAAVAAEPEVYARSERRWLIPTALIILVGVALGLAGVLIGRTEAGQQIIDAARQIVTSSNESRDGAPAEVAVTGARAFDPLADGQEEDDIVHLAVDGNPDTAWHTEFYDVGTWERKGGVGLVVLLDRSAALDVLEVQSPTTGWAASIHVAETAADDLAGWGDPVTSRSGIEAGTASFDLDGRRGSAVLIWFTDLGEAPPNALRLHVADVAVRAR